MEKDWLEVLRENLGLVACWTVDNYPQLALVDMPFLIFQRTARGHANRSRW